MTSSVPFPVGRPKVAPRNGLEVIGWMRHAHPSRALRSLAFSVTTTLYTGDTNVVRRSRAYAALPGRLRVEHLPVATRTGYVRDRQRLAIFEGGRRVSRQNHVDLTMVVAFDIFAQSVDTTVMWLDSARVRFGLLRSDELDGRRVWVVGALPSDTSITQFWVDAEWWRVLRVMQRDAAFPGDLVDIRVTEYTELLDVPVPTRLQVYRNGRIAEQQDISDLTANPPLSSRVFDLARWRPFTIGN
jgi:hypothetical protein